MIQTIFTSDSEAIDYLKSICEFNFKLIDGQCTEISFHDENSLLGGLLRRNPNKYLIIDIVSNFENLKYLNVKKCKISNIPKMKSKKIEYLDLSCNDMETFPDWILSQSGLKFLNIGSNQIKEVPNLSDLNFIETLKLHKNKISILPKISNKIKSLNVFLNPLLKFPNEILDFYLLEVFTFGVTESKILPSFSSLLNLRWLTLTVNEFKELPEDICNLSKLEGLQLAKNKIEKLPPKIGDLNLRFLTLYSNSISELPNSFFDLSLQKLNVAKNCLDKKTRDKLHLTFKDINFLRLL